MARDEAMSSLTPDQFRTIEQLFFEASAKPAPERDAFIESASDDDTVRREVRAMLALGEQGGGSTNVQLGIEQLARDAEDLAIEAWVGRQVGAYRIDGVLARGGMGVVFRGHDVRLDRPVAIKVISGSIAADTLRLQRFRREARTIASLTHPNIAAVYGLEDTEGRQFLVMELLKGPSLAERLRRGGALPIDEALQVGKQVAAAMQAAHDEGVIHRDLKPGNVLFAADGSVKVLDFGLARSDEATTADFDADARTTTALPVTREGLAVGTPGYMSPEQARGQNVDRRTDVFAFGCLLFECLTGKAAFAGDSQVDMLTAVLHREPDWARLPSRTPPNVRRLLERCTAKEPARRMRDMGDIRLELEDALRDGVPSTSGFVPAALAPPPARSRTPAALLAAGLLAAVVGTLTWMRPESPPPAEERSHHVSRFTVEFPQSLPQRTLSRLGLALSRDGRNLVYFAAGPEGVVSMWRRGLDQLELEPISDTEGGAMPFFSPDGRWVGYVVNGVMKKRWLGGSNSIRLHEVHGVWGADWSDTHQITFVYTWGQPLAQMSSDGGGVHRINAVRADAGETSHLSPTMFRSGKGVLYTVWVGGTAMPRIDMVNVETGKQQTIAEQGCTPRLAMTPYGLHLLWVRRNTLFAAPFDEERSAITGPEVALVDNVLTDAPQAQAYFAVSDEGTLAYVPGPLFTEEMRLAWADLEKGSGSTPFNDDRLPFADPRFSADGKKLSLILRRNAYQGFVYDLERNILERASTEQDSSSGSISPDGRLYAYGSNRTGRYTLWLRDLRTGLDRRVVPDEYDFPGFVSWSPDGKSLAMCVAPTATSSRDIVLVEHLDSEPRARAFQPTPYHETGPVFSPDGKWLAYSSAFSPTESSAREVYVSSMPDGAIKRQVSADGGHSPQWSPDGRTLYYRRFGAIVAVAINPESGAASGQGRTVWRGTFGQTDPDLTDYAVAPDGRVLLVEQSENGYAVDHIHVILNWHRLLNREE